MATQSSFDEVSVVPVARSVAFVAGDAPAMREWAEELVARARAEGVELTGVRTGLFVAGEVEPAKKMVLNETGGSSRLTSKSKLRDLAVFALSDELHLLRAAVGTNVEVQVQARR